MALIVATAGAIDADSYASTADIAAYWTKLNDPAYGAAATEAQEAAARRATQFLDAQYGDRLAGCKFVSDPEQLLEFPREDELIPARLVSAIAELSKMALTGPLVGTGSDGSPSQAAISSLKAGSVEISYRETANVQVQADQAGKFYLVEKLLRPLLKGSGLNRGTSR